MKKDEKKKILQMAREEKIKNVNELKEKGIEVYKIFKNDKNGLIKLRAILKYNRIKF